MTATALSLGNAPAIGKVTLELSYVLPIKSQTLAGAQELSVYLEWLASQVGQVIVVDGSPRTVFLAHEAMWAGLGVRHMTPDEHYATSNGKVAGVLTGLYAATHERLIIADEDVRYDRDALEAMVQRLDSAHVVRPQNYFEPLTWHARWDTARSLLNRATDGDWPGTLGVRRSALLATQGYDGDCLFENLELVRTVIATGGTEALARDVYVRRLPPRTAHFFSQRVRQAYDEFARPVRLMAQLCLLPSLLLLARRPKGLVAASMAVAACAEYGRRRNGGAAVFPATSSLMAPLWLAERAVCSWLAVLTRVRNGGVPYYGRTIRRAATAQAELNQRYEATR